MKKLLLITLLLLSACGAETERGKLCKFLDTCSLSPDSPGGMYGE